MVDLVTFGVIIDDIIFPDGSSQMGILGGGGVQTAFGMRLWSPSVGLVSGVGEDYLEVVKSWLEESGIDEKGIHISDLPTPRAWQLLEYDERRTQIWRVPPEVIKAQLRRAVEFMPPEYRSAKGFHFGYHPDEPGLGFLEDLHSLGGIVSVEPFKAADHLPERENLHALLMKTDIFSANQREALSLVGEDDPLKQIKAFLELGAKQVVIRLGGQGSIAADSVSGKYVKVPAVPVDVVDPVGAGNAYCGGFLAGWVEHHDIAVAAVYGSVSASFLVEQVGVPAVNDGVMRISRQRLEELTSQVSAFTL